ncbi:hypothetical protein [Bradyrhizobium sp. LA6.12]|uniref:hypothetical protein n=1 Tax=unclassified Bradyrhizobium TaxID=2631580 RepID=UPI003397FAAC
MAEPSAKHVLMAKHRLEQRRNGFEVDQSLINIDFDWRRSPGGDCAEPAGPLERPVATGRGGVREGPIETRGKVSDAQFAAVKDAGLTDANIVEMIALTGSSCCLFGRAAASPSRGFGRAGYREIDRRLHRAVHEVRQALARFSDSWSEAISGQLTQLRSLSLRVLKRSTHFLEQSGVRHE